MLMLQAAKAWSTTRANAETSQVSALEVGYRAISLGPASRVNRWDTHGISVESRHVVGAASFEVYLFHERVGFPASPGRPAGEHDEELEFLLDRHAAVTGPEDALAVQFSESMPAARLRGHGIQIAGHLGHLSLVVGHDLAPRSSRAWIRAAATGVPTGCTWQRVCLSGSILYETTFLARCPSPELAPSRRPALAAIERGLYDVLGHL